MWRTYGPGTVHPVRPEGQMRTVIRLEESEPWTVLGNRLQAGRPASEGLGGEPGRRWHGCSQWGQMLQRAGASSNPSGAPPRPREPCPRRWDLNPRNPPELLSAQASPWRPDLLSTPTSARRAPGRQPRRAPSPTSGSRRASRGMGVSAILALLPAYLRDMGVAEADRLAFVGLFSRGLRGRPAARPAVGRLGGQVQPQGRHHPERPCRGGRVRGRRALAGAVAAGALDAAHRPPARQHRGDAGGHPRCHAAAPPRSTIALFGAVGPIGFAFGPAWRGSSSTGSAVAAGRLLALVRLSAACAGLRAHSRDPPGDDLDGRGAP